MKHDVLSGDAQSPTFNGQKQLNEMKADPTLSDQIESATEYYQFSMINPNGEVYNPHNTFETNESTTYDEGTH